MIADITFTPTQLYGVAGVLIAILSAVLVVRKVFNYATTEDVHKMEKDIKAEMEKHTVQRHEMRHEITRLQVAMGKLENQVAGNTTQLHDIQVTLAELPDRIFARMRNEK